jgi:hypothetical protein
MGRPRVQLAQLHNGRTVEYTTEDAGGPFQFVVVEGKRVGTVCRLRGSLPWLWTSRGRQDRVRTKREACLAILGGCK